MNNNSSTPSTLTNHSGNPSLNISLVEITLWSAVFIILYITIVTSNVLVLYYYLSYRHSHRERPKGHLFLINLSVMDLLVGAVSLPLYVYFLMIWFFKGWTPYQAIFYHLYKTSDIITGFGSMLTVVLLSIDRCSAVVFPFRHRSIKRSTYIYGMIVVWSTAIAIALTSLLTFITNRNHFIFDYASGAVFMLSITTVITTNVLTILRAKALKNHSEEELRRHVAYHKRLSRTFKMVIIVFFGTWLPFQCISYSYLVIDDKTVIPTFLTYLTKMLQYGGSFINCIIYYNNNREFKASIRMLFNVHRRSRKYRVSGQIHANHGMSLEITNNQSP